MRRQNSPRTTISFCPLQPPPPDRTLPGPAPSPSSQLPYTPPHRLVDMDRPLDLDQFPHHRRQPLRRQRRYRLAEFRSPAVIRNVRDDARRQIQGRRRCRFLRLVDSQWRVGGNVTIGLLSGSSTGRSRSSFNRAAVVPAPARADGTNPLTTRETASNPIPRGRSVAADRDPAPSANWIRRPVAFDPQQIPPRLTRIDHGQIDRESRTSHLRVNIPTGLAQRPAHRRLKPRIKTIPWHDRVL